MNTTLVGAPRLQQMYVDLFRRSQVGEPHSEGKAHLLRADRFSRETVNNIIDSLDAEMLLLLINLNRVEGTSDACIRHVPTETIENLSCFPILLWFTARAIFAHYYYFP
jgi:hypothetical protein